MLIKVGNDLFRILELHHLTPGNKRAHIQARMRNIRTLALADHKFRAEEDVERAMLDEREMQYLYNDGDTTTSWTRRRYEQIHISTRGARRLEELPDRRDRSSASSSTTTSRSASSCRRRSTWSSRKPSPGIKGATASAQVKPATLETGLVVQVPPFVNEGDKVRVNTETGEYQSRA